MTRTDCEPIARWSARSALRRAFGPAAIAGPAEPVRMHVASANARNRARAGDVTICRSNDWPSQKLGRLLAVARGQVTAVHRFEEHALRPAEGTNRLQPSVTNAVVNRSPGDAQRRRRGIKGDAAADTWLIPGICSGWCRRHVSLRMPDIKARTMPFGRCTLGSHLSYCGCDGWARIRGEVR